MSERECPKHNFYFLFFSRLPTNREKVREEIERGRERRERWKERRERERERERERRARETQFSILETVPSVEPVNKFQGKF